MLSTGHLHGQGRRNEGRASAPEFSDAAPHPRGEDAAPPSPDKRERAYHPAAAFSVPLPIGRAHFTPPRLPVPLPFGRGRREARYARSLLRARERRVRDKQKNSCPPHRASKASRRGLSGEADATDRPAVPGARYERERAYHARRNRSGDNRGIVRPAGSDVAGWREMTNRAGGGGRVANGSGARAGEKFVGMGQLGDGVFREPEVGLQEIRRRRSDHVA